MDLEALVGEKVACRAIVYQGTVVSLSQPFRSRSMCATLLFLCGVFSCLAACQRRNMAKKDGEQQKKDNKSGRYKGARPKATKDRQKKRREELQKAKKKQEEDLQAGRSYYSMFVPSTNPRRSLNMQPYNICVCCVPFHGRLLLLRPKW